MVDTANTVWRDYVTDGVPASGVWAPKKSDIRAWGTDVEADISELEASAAGTGSQVSANTADIADHENRITTLEGTVVEGINWTGQKIVTRTSANFNITSGLVNGATINGVTVATGDFVAVLFQSTASQNGIYTVVASGAASRSTFADSAAELAHIGFVIDGGDFAGERWTLPLDTAEITVGTTALNFGKVGIEVGYAAEVEEARGTYDALGDRLDAADAKIAAGGQLKLLRDALSNPFKQLLGIALIGDSITWGTGATGTANPDPRDGTLSDPRDDFTSDSWANLFKRWIGENYADASSPVLSNFAASPSGESYATYGVTQYVLPRYGDVTASVTGSSFTLTETYGSGFVLNTQVRFSDGSAGTSYGTIVIENFTGSSFTFVYGSASSNCLDYELFVDGVSQGTFSTSAGVDGAVVGNGNEREHTFSYVRDKTITIKTKRNVTDSGTQVLYSEAFKMVRQIRINNQGINGASSYTYRTRNMTGNGFGDGVAVNYVDEFILVQLGTNDRARSTGVASGPGFFKYNYGLLLDDAMDYGHVICMVANKTTTESFVTYACDMQDIRRVIFEVAEDKGLDVIDNYLAFDRDDLASLLNDGLHPNDAGHALMFENIVDKIETGISAV